MALRLSANTFLADLARQGAIFNYFVKFDANTTTSADIERDTVNLQLGVAPLKPTEYLVIQLQ